MIFDKIWTEAKNHWTSADHNGTIPSFHISLTEANILNTEEFCCLALIMSTARMDF